MTGHPVVVGVSLKAYFGHARARAWCEEVADRVGGHRAITSGGVEVFVAPTHLQVLPALEAFRGTGVRVGVQDASAHGAGPYTGEVTAAEAAEVGVRYAEVGHAERRRLFGETDDVVAAKTAAALGAGLVPVLCIGEEERVPAEAAAAVTAAQLGSALAGATAGAVVVAYEPVWAIGAPRPAPVEGVRAVARRLRAALDDDPARRGSSLVYGGSAGPGLLTELGDDVDGLFLGRSAHDPAALVAVLDEAADLAARRRSA